MVPVPDPRLEQLAAIAHPEKILPTTVEFVDIAGLVAGASQGEGLGNQFLAHIREVDAIAHVVRCFENDDIVHVAGRIDPLSDVEIINTELALADLAIGRQGAGPRRQGRQERRQGGACAGARCSSACRRCSMQGKPVRALPLSEEERRELRELHLLTAKPVMYIANVDEAGLAADNALSDARCARAPRPSMRWWCRCARRSRRRSRSCRRPSAPSSCAIWDSRSRG